MADIQYHSHITLRQGTISVENGKDKAKKNETLNEREFLITVGNHRRKNELPFLGRIV